MRNDRSRPFDLVGGEAVHLLGAAVPADELAVEILGGDGVGRRLDDRRQPAHVRLAALERADVDEREHDAALRGVER